MLVSPAFAQDGGGGFGLDGIGPLLPLILIFVVFYFLLIRPQQKKAKAHRAMIGELRRGDRIVTSGGLVGNIHRIVGDSELMVEIADGVRVRIMRAMVAELVAKPEPRRSRDDDDDDDDNRTHRRNRGRSKAREEVAEDADDADSDDDRDDDDDRGDDDRDDDDRDDDDRDADDDDRDQETVRRSRS